MMFVESSGNGPEVVLLHGWGLHGGFFAPLADQLAARFTVHCVDLPGHGRSVNQSFDTAAITTELSARFGRAHVVGWSMGGLLAQLLPSPRSLTLIASSAKFLRDSSWQHGVDANVLDAFAADLRTDFAQTMARFVDLEVLGATSRSGRPAALQQATRFGPPSADALGAGLDFLRQFDRRQPLSGPALWIGGARDRMIHPNAIRASADLSNHGRALIVRGAGHAPFITHAAELFHAIAEHLDHAEP
jgi:pimeloyl-[acyl-carrier protein] methyl ester esterase